MQLTAQDARQSLADHVAAKGSEIHARYPKLGWTELRELLNHRDYVRYPCEVVFMEEGLLPGEPAHAEAAGETPEEGFRLLVHPRFQEALDEVPALILYQLVAVNYGRFAGAEEAEAFGAAALGLEREEYYQQICGLADRLVAASPEIRITSTMAGQAKKC